MLVAAISRESLHAFIERIGGTASLISIGSRFGWEEHTARQEVNAAVALGKLVWASNGDVCSAGPLTTNRRNTDRQI